MKALASALIKNCTHLQHLHLTGPKVIPEVKEMMLAAGAWHRLHDGIKFFVEVGR